MIALRRTKETIAGGGLLLALLMLSVSGIAAAGGAGCGMQLVSDDDYTSTEIVVENDLVKPSWPDGREITIDGTTYKKTASTRIESRHIVIEPGIKTGDLDPMGMKTLLTGEEIVALTDDDNYGKAWPKPKVEIGDGSGSILLNDDGTSQPILDPYTVDADEMIGIVGKTLTADISDMNPSGLVEGLLDGGVTTFDDGGFADANMVWVTGAFVS